MCLSLPSLANNAMFRNFDVNSPLEYSVAKKNEDIRQLIRDNEVGGLVNVYRRHVSTLNPTLPDNVQRVPNGDVITWIGALDFNALYGYCQLLELPTTPGMYIYIYILILGLWIPARLVQQKILKNR